ncbi:hypothetical protein CTAYLR_006851 [Chrysophaeum taylorii]|uniref:Uncharacterized protein n=1 Tax=Chrysophaeum taylorii TaxID=2483200 RepID=A0AAD7XEP7_9STRA|nr:hypothetical protein CTAYLR_006851 [Chrysophaeum taylorii]
MRALLAAVAIAACWVTYLMMRAPRNVGDGHPGLAAPETWLRARSPPLVAPPARPPVSSKPPPQVLLPPVVEPAPEPSSRVHVVFSTDCSAYQDWQTEVVFNSALVVGHAGPLTRIASGCGEAERRRLSELPRVIALGGLFQGARYAALYPDLFDSRIFVHFTPAFNKDEASGNTYHFYNKPRGIEHWLAEPGSSASRTEIVALIDPDFAFLRPLSDEFDRKRELVVISPWTVDDVPRRVERGVPFGQQYGLGTHWRRFDRAAICGADSPCVATTEKDAYKFYPVGPPYVAHVDDWRRIAPVWREFAPRVYAQYPNLLAEMYAYCMAAAHLELPHVRVNHLMLSNAAVKDEGWPLVDALPLALACPADPEADPPLVARQVARNHALPAFVHFCQNYRLGDWMFAKRRVPRELFVSCDRELLAPPPADVWKFRYELQPPGNPCRDEPKRKPLTNPRIANRTALSMCLATWHTNAAARHATGVSRRRELVRHPRTRVKLYDIATHCWKKKTPAR